MNLQHLKRCFSLILIMALMLTAMPVQAFAAADDSEELVETVSEVPQYTVTFYDSDGTVLQTVTVDEGSIPECDIPTKDSDDYGRYEFSGWDPEVSEAYSDAEYYAVWNSVKQYTVTFEDWDGTVIKEFRIDENTVIAEADIPENPEREADAENTYAFKEWDKDLTAAITEDTTITAVYTSEDIPAVLTFNTAENGSYTVNGEAVEETRVENTTAKTSYTLVATPADGYDFFGWYNGEEYLTESSEYTFKPLEDMEITPVFVPEGTVRLAVGHEYFSSFDEAVKAAKKAEDKTIVLMNDGVLSAGEYEIPEGVTLLIPYNEERTVYTTEPECFDETWESPVAYRTLTLAEGAELTVEGALSLAAPHVPAAGSKENGGTPHKAYGQIVTEEGSTITVENGGALYAYGYITGNGTVTAESGAVVYEYFQIMDFRGGSATTSMIASGYGVLPINQYYVQNIEVPLTLEAGANEYCYTSAKMSGNTLSSSVAFIGTGNDAMFKLTSGTMTKWYDGDTDRLMAVVNGNMNISPINIAIGNKDVSSDDFVLPINSNITIEIASGSVNISQDVALIPGSELIIDEGAECILSNDSKVFVYDADEWGNYSSSNRKTFVDVNYAPGKNYTRTDADLVDAKILVNGTLNASDGYLYSTENGANIYSTGAGEIILRKGNETTTYQFEYMGTPDTGYDLYGIYHEIAITAALLKNADGSYVSQDEYETKGIISYEYIDGVWTAVGHVIFEDEGYPASCNTAGLTEGQHCNFGEGCTEHYVAQEEIPALGHDMQKVEAKKPTYTSIGWNEHEECTRCGEKSEDYEEIAKLEGAVIDNYDDFLENLELLEQWADEYVASNPGKDPAALVIKYIRTGVDRYNSGSWGIMAGYEDKDFAAYVDSREDAYNSVAAEHDMELLKVSGLKNLVNFTVPNGDEVDFGHMFGTMDITYNNNFSVNHADVAGWAGDIVDLLSLADQFGTGDAETVNEMAEYIYDNYLFKETEELEDTFGEDLKEGSFSMVDMIGDLDGYYIMKVLETTEYESGTLTQIIKEYCTEDLTEAERAEYLLENRFEDKTLRADLRDEVYSEVANNKVVNTLEATREFESDDLTDLRKACCYAFADYICQQAGDYVDALENEYMSVFTSTFSTLAPGITQKTYQAKTADGKQMDYYIATADVTREDVQVYANYNNNDPSQGWAMQRVIDQANAAQERYGNPESEEYIENYNVIASINGGGYDMSTGEPSGLLLMKGVEWHACNDAGFFGILSDGTAMIGTKAEYEALKAEGKIEEAIGGFGTTLVKDGKVCITATSEYYTSRASRTAVGITKTGKVVFMVLDGRQGEYSCGGSMEEIAQIMLDAGCEIAINLDGGGSSTYVARQEGEDELSVTNNPSDGISRSVSTSLFMVSTAPSSTAFDHAVLESDYSYMTVGSSIQMNATGVSATNNGVDLPEGTVWAVEDESIAEITEEGMLTAKAEGDVDVLLMLEGEVVGRTTIHVVTPDNLYFLRTSANAVYGQTVEIPVKAVYKNKAVAVNANDVTFTLSDNTAGTIDGFYFTASETSGLKTVQITASLPGNESVSAVFTLYLYNQGEASFDFDKATGGDLQFAWDRNISNTVTDDGITYSIVDRDEDMTTSYSFAIDMSQIGIPEELEDLTYMLPGADIEGASAWTFLCQLAERMSDLTEVRPVIVFDEDVEVDYSDITLVNDYFELNGKEFDEETNTLTLTLNWKKQDKPIDVAMANPICILSGIEITPKDDAEWTKDHLSIVNSGEISYTVYMRASGLYTFSQNAANQAKYGLEPYQHPENENEKGGKFTSTYKEFEDSYTLDRSIKNGWVGLRYYDNGEMYTGICLVNGYYHYFDEDGINKGQEKYTGELTVDGKEYYVNNGEIFKEGCSMWTSKDNGWIRFGDNDWRYYDPETGVREKVTVEAGEHTCIIDTVYTFTSESGKVKSVRRDDAGGHEYVQQEDGSYVCSVCGWTRVEMEDVNVTLSFTKATYNGSKKRPVVTATHPVTGETLTRQDPYADYKIVYSNNLEVGTASVKLNAYRHGHYVNLQEWRGNYSNSAIVTYTIYPDRPASVKGTYSGNTVNLTWTAAKVTETDTEDNVTSYVIYQSVNGGKWTEVGTTEKTSYTIKKLDSSKTYKFRVGTRKTGTDGKEYESLYYTAACCAPDVDASNVASTGKVKLTWNKVGGAKEYVVYRSTSKNGTYTKMFTTTKLSYINTNADAGKTYYYKVKTVYSDGSQSGYSSVVTRTCDLARPKVTASNVASTGKVKLTWTKVKGADKYVVYRATSKNGTYKKMFTTTKLSYINTNAVAGKAYYYKVKAIDTDKSAANSAYSVVDKRTCDLKRPVVTAKRTTKNRVTLTWKKVSGAKKYVVYRATSKNGTYKAMYSTTKLSYTNTTAKSGKTYYYKVKAIAANSAANSAYSAVDKCKCK